MVNFQGGRYAYGLTDRQGPFMDLVSISIARRSNFRGRYAKNYVSLLARVAESSAHRHLRRSIEKSGLKLELPLFK